MSDLQSFDAARPQKQPPLPRSASLITTPLNLETWSQALTHHPDPTFAQYILSGIRDGFRIGFDYNSHRCRPAKSNMLSAKEHPQVVIRYIDGELAHKRLVKLASHAQSLLIQTSPLGVIPKRLRANEWRLILDLSSPNNYSVNDGISTPACSIRYASLDDAVNLARTLGNGALLAKLDIKSAYRMVPVHPDDRPLLGIKWRDSIFLDTTLPFGLRSAPKIFSAVADALLWAMHCNGVQHALHYLDDFLFVGPAGNSSCANQLHTALATCRTLGVPIAPEKIQGPAQVLTFLGIEINTITMQLTLPDTKLSELREALRFWTDRKSCTKRQLLSLIGRLHHAASVVKPGRTFLRHLINLSTTASKLHHHIRLSESSRSDIHWWNTFLSSWNGISMLPPSQPQVSIESDASGAWGCATIWNSHFFQIQWPETWQASNIAAKELLPIVVAAATWGAQWAGNLVLCLCDNAAVVAVINTGSCRDTHLMQMMRCLFFYAAHYHFSLTARHVPGAINTKADALSRNNIQLFRSLLPQADPIPTSIPPHVLDLSLANSPHWTSSHWRQMFVDSLKVA